MFRTAPFLRAPFLLFRHFPVLAALAGAGAIVGLVAALTPQFLSSAASQAMEQELAGRCPSSYAGSIASTRAWDPRFAPLVIGTTNRQRLDEELPAHPNLGEPVATIEGRNVAAHPVGNPAGSVPLVFLHRSGFREHLEVLRGGTGPGVWIDEYAAFLLDADVGDEVDYTLVLRVDGDRRVVEGSVRVAAITDDLQDRRFDEYWCVIEHLLEPNRLGDRPPPIALVDLEFFGADPVPGELSDEVLLREDELWEIPIATEGLSIARAESVMEIFTDVGEALLGDPEAVHSDLKSMIRRVQALADALTTSVRPIAVVVWVVALGLMAGAGSYWVDRRTAELRMLAAKGVGPVALGVKACLESALPVAIGISVGAVLARPIARLVGPGGTIDPSSTTRGFALAAAAAGAALLVVGTIAGVRSGRILDAPRSRKPSVRRRLWVLAGLAAAALAVRWLIGDEAVRFGANDLVGSVPILVVLFPLLLFGFVALLTSEVVHLVVPRLTRLTTRSSALYLATRRIGASRAMVIVLVTGVLIPVATLLYSTALTRSTEVTMDTKALVFIGADVRTPIYRLESLTERLEAHSTVVHQAERVEFEGESVDVLAVDPDTFLQGAFWDPTFSALPIADLFEIMRRPGPQLHVIVANARLRAQRGVLEVGSLELPVVVGGTVDSFPGVRGDRPLVIMSRSRLDELIETADLPATGNELRTWLWTSGLDVDVVEADLLEADVGFAFTTPASRILDHTKFLAVIWTFDFLELYTGLAGLFVIGFILLYVDTRQRSRNLSYALARRMGIRRRDHLLAGFFEIGGLAFAGALAGIPAAILAARSIHTALDPLPATPPSPRWIYPLDVTIILAITTLVVGALAAWTAQRTADSADVSELLRHEA